MPESDVGFEISSVSLRSMDFEILGPAEPASEVQSDLMMGAARPDPGVLLVDLRTVVSVGSAFRAEVEYRGVFRVLGDADEKTVKTFAARVAPAAIYPFLREGLADATVRAGLPPFQLPIMNFATAFVPDAVEFADVEILKDQSEE